MRRVLFLLTVPLLLLTLRPVLVAAQSRLFDGASLVGRIAPDSPSAQYGFDASRGDHIGLRVMGLNGLNSVMTVRGPDGTVLMTGYDDAWSPEPGDSLVTFTAPDGGGYSVLVEGEGGSGGDFVLQFEQSPAGSAALLPGGQSAVVPVSAAAGPMRLQFAANPGCPTVLVVQPSGGSPGFNALVNLLDAQGALVAQLGAGPAEKRITLAADSGLYVAEIVPLPGSADGEMVLTAACAAEQPGCTEPPASAEAAPAAATPAGLLLVQPGGDLSYGASLQGELGQSSPLVGYTFEGAAGDEITVQVTSISLDFNPVVSLLGPTLSAITSSDDSPGTFRPADALLRAVLPEDGTYTALVGGADDLAGVFLVRLLKESASAPAALNADAPIVIDAGALEGADGLTLRYQFTALESCPTALDLAVADGSGLSVGAVVRKAAGEAIGQIYPSGVAGINLVVPAGSGDYEVLIPRRDDLEDLDPITLSVSCQSDSAACTAGNSSLLISTPTPGEPPFATATIAPGVTPTVTLTGSSGAEVAGVVAVPSANVRRGDSTSFGVIRALASGDQVTILGISSSGSSWFKVLMPQGDEGWMSPQVLTITGDTSRLPRLIPPQAPPTAAPGVATVAPGASAVCGNAVCEADEASNCCGDCGTCGGGGSIPPTQQPASPVCGNATCESGESCSSCAQDCGSGGPDACASYCVCPNVARQVQSCDVCLSNTCPNGSTPACYAPRG